MNQGKVIRVLIVDDSALVRDILKKLLSEDPQILVIGEACDGQEAVQFCHTKSPDLILMDIEMPRMNGLEAIGEIMATQPTPILVLSSQAKPANVALSFQAIQSGALELMEKPVVGNPHHWEATRKRLIEKIKILHKIKVVRHIRPTRRVVNLGATTGALRYVLVGASTGGPQVLHQLFTRLKPDFSFAMVIVQHMTPGFLQGMVQWLSTAAPHRLKVAQDRELLRSGTIYFAPEEKHCLLHYPGQLSLRTDLPKWTEHQPCVNYLMKSAAEFSPRESLGIILTGMGKDGAEGLLALKQSGGKTIAQDEESSLIYGMPREAYARGGVDQVMNPPQMADYLNQCRGGSS